MINMNEPIRIDFVRLDRYPEVLGTFSEYFEPKTLVNSAPNCVIDVNSNMDYAYNMNQMCLDSLGDVLSVESEKLQLVSDTFSCLEDTLTTLFQQG